MAHTWRQVHVPGDVAGAAEGRCMAIVSCGQRRVVRAHVAVPAQQLVAAGAKAYGSWNCPRLAHVKLATSQRGTTAPAQALQLEFRARRCTNKTMVNRWSHVTTDSPGRSASTCGSRFLQRHGVRGQCLEDAGDTGPAPVRCHSATAGQGAGRSDVGRQRRVV